MDYDVFFESFRNLVDNIRKVNGPIRVIGHLDSDGLASLSILTKALMRENIKFSVSAVKQVNAGLIDELVNEDYEHIIFVDVGSGSLKLMSEKLNDRKIFVLDHHKCENFKAKNIFHINPFLFGIDGDIEISGAGLAYLFAKELNGENKDLAYLAIIGAIGDIQEKKGFKGINELILKDAVDCGSLEVRKGLNMFGMQTKPIHKVLQHSTEPYIPGVTGNEKGAISFIEELGIDLKSGKDYKRLVDLNEEDMNKLIMGIIIKRLGSEENPEDVIGPIYLLNGEEDDSPTRDAREFSTLLNSCGRLHKSSLGIGACLGNKKLKKEAVELLSTYRKEIIRSLDWFYSNKKNDCIIEKKGYVIINAEENIKDTLVGTIASIISNSNIYNKNTIIVSMTHTLDGDIKVSMRFKNYGKDIDLRPVIKEVVSRFGGSGGGHRYAGGCLISQDYENDFIEFLQKVLDKYLLEEIVK